MSVISALYKQAKLQREQLVELRFRPLESLQICFVVECRGRDVVSRTKRTDSLTLAPLSASCLEPTISSVDNATLQEELVWRNNVMELYAAEVSPKNMSKLL